MLEHSAGEKDEQSSDDEQPSDDKQPSDQEQSSDDGSSSDHEASDDDAAASHASWGSWDPSDNPAISHGFSSRRDYDTWLNSDE